MIKQVKNLEIINQDKTLIVDLDNQILKKELTLKKYSICSLVGVFLNQVCIKDIELQDNNIINLDIHINNKGDRDNNKVMIIRLVY